MEKEQSNDLYQETKNDQIQRISSDNFNLTGLSKNQAIPYSELEKSSSINKSNGYLPEKSSYFGNQMLGFYGSAFDDNNSQNNLNNLYKLSNNSFKRDLNNQIPTSFQDLTMGNNANGFGWIDQNLLGTTFPKRNNQTQPKTNQQPLQFLDFQRSSELSNSNENSNQSNKNQINGFGKGISSNNSNFNFSLQNFNKSVLSNDNNISNFNPLSGFGSIIQNNDIQQNKGSVTKLSSSSSSSRTHSTIRGTTIIIQSQQNNDQNIAVKQSSDSFPQENRLNQIENNINQSENILSLQDNLLNQSDKVSSKQEFNNKIFMGSDQLGQKLFRDFSDELSSILLRKNQNPLTQLFAEKFGKENSNKFQLQDYDNLNNIISQTKVEDIVKQEDENNDKKQKKRKNTKKQNLKNEERGPVKKYKSQKQQFKSVDQINNFSDETQGLIDEDHINSSKNQIKLEDEKYEQHLVKKEQIEEEKIEQISEQISTENKPKSIIEKHEQQEKKSSSRQSQHKNVYKNFGKELLRFVRTKCQSTDELTEEEVSYLLEQLTGGLNDKDTKQTLPIQKKEKLQMLWTLKQEKPTSHNSHKKSKNDHKDNEDKQSEYYFITEKDDEISQDDNIDLKAKKYFRQISWEFFNEWAFQYVMSSRKLDKKEIHLKCIPSFLYGIMCPKSLEVFKPIREHERVVKQAN